MRDIATQLGQRWGRAPQFNGRETETSLVVNPARLCEKLGTPPTQLDTMLNWTSQWVESGGRDLGKPTHFETRDGQY